MLRIRKTKLGLLLCGVLTITLFAAAVWAQNSRAFAAPSEWVNSSGNPFGMQYLSENPDFFHNNFTVLDTQTIMDNGTRRRYVTAAIPAYDMANSGATPTSAGDNDNNFVYWPVDEANNIITTPINGKCQGGFYLQAKRLDLNRPGNASNNSFSTIVYIQPTLDGPTGQCILAGRSLASWTGKQMLPVDEILGANVWINQGEAQMFTSMYSWQNSRTLAVTGWGDRLTKIDEQNPGPPGALSKIRADLQGLGVNADGGIFTTDACATGGADSRYKAFVVIDPGNPLVASIYHYNNGDVNSNIEPNWHSNQQSCLYGNRNYDKNPVSRLRVNGNEIGIGGDANVFFMAWTQNASLPPDQNQPDDPLTGEAPLGSAQSRNGCENNTPLVSLSWWVCGLIGIADDAISGLQDQLAELLEVDSSLYNDNPQLREAWSYFRNIASFLLIAIGLVMVIGQAIGRD